MTKLARNFAVMTAFFSCLLGSTLYAESDSAVKTGAESVVGKTAEKRKRGPVYRKGILRGVVDFYDEDDRYIVVNPINRGRSTTVYLDKKTLYRMDKRRGTRKDLRLKQKVAVRFFGKDYLFVADEVCMVTETFDRDHCKRPLPKQTLVEKKE